MNKIEAAAAELKKLGAYNVSSVCLTFCDLANGEEDTLCLLGHAQWAEARLLGARDVLKDLDLKGEDSTRAAIEVFIEVALEGINEARQGIGKEAA